MEQWQDQAGANEILKSASVNSTGRCNTSFEFSRWSDEAERVGFEKYV